MRFFAVNHSYLALQTMYVIASVAVAIRFFSADYAIATGFAPAYRQAGSQWRSF
jgi:hypothetical protein